MSDIEFYYDVVCPYAYLGALQLKSLKSKTEAQIHWKPILLGGIFRYNQSPDIPAHTWPNSKIQYGIMDLMRQAKKQGISLKYHPKHPVRTVEAMRLLSMLPLEKVSTVSLRIFKAYWEEGKDISNPDVLNIIAKEEGINEDLFLAPQAREKLHTQTEEAHKKGVFGVPTFIHKEKIWWGQDRIHLLEHTLGATKKAFPRQKPDRNPKITFFHDFASPFSYLGARQIPNLEKTYDIKIEYKPILLGALFRNIGTPDVPIFAMSKPKQKYMMRDLNDWADFWNVPFAFPKVFPVRSVLPLRISIIAPECIQDIYTAMWVEGKDISNQDVIQQIVEARGYSWEECLSKIPEAKEILIQNTTQAEKIGVCGVPSLVCNNSIWWGQDRIHDCMQELFAT